MAETVIARFDGAAAWAALTPDNRDEIGAMALELVAGWLASDGAPLTPVSRASEEALSRITSGLVDRATDMLTLDTFMDGERGRVPSLLGQVCRRCGCSERDACPDGCAWASENLCTACVSIEETVHG